MTPPNLIPSFPHDMEAERIILGCLIIDNEKIDGLRAALKSSDFLLESHQVIYTAIQTIYDADKPVDLVTLTWFLGDRCLLDRVGGSAYISGLVDNIPKIINAPHYAKRVSDKAQLRFLMTAGQRMVNESAVGCGDPKTIFSAVMDDFFSQHESHDLSMDSIDDLFDAWIDAVENESVLTLGFPSLDAVIRAQRGELMIVPGKSSAGKTSLILNICVQIIKSKPKARIAFFSGETSKSRIFSRLIEIDTGVNWCERVARWKRNIETKDDYNALIEKYRASFRYQIADMTPETVRSSIRIVERSIWKEPPDYIIIDYLDKLGAHLLERKSEIETTTWLAHKLQNMAKASKSFWIVLHQLNKTGAVDQEVDHSHLRSSGKVVDCADYILTAKRPRAKDPDNDDQIDVGVLKNKDGVSGISIPFKWHGHTLQMTEMCVADDKTRYF